MRFREDRFFGYRSRDSMAEFGHYFDIVKKVAIFLNDYQVYGLIMVYVEIDYAFLCAKTRKNAKKTEKKVQFFDPSMTQKVTAMTIFKNTVFDFFDDVFRP